MKSTLCLLAQLSLLILAIACCQKKETVNEPLPPPPPEPVYYRGMDLSFQPEIRDWQAKYYDSAGQEIELLPFLAAKGVNLVRLRLWHTPATGYNGLERVVSYAREVKAKGMDILLDFHYSDTWADPGQQQVPAAWQGLSADVLNDSIYAYTRFVMSRFMQEDAFPVMVQVGNETNSGFLWNQGRVGGLYNDNWTGYTTLVKSAVRGIREISGEAGKEVKVMLHVAGVNTPIWFFDNMAQYLVDYDVIGLSFYSIWHGTDYPAWESKFTEIANRYNKEIMVVETAYPWTLGWNDWTNNFYGLEEQLFPDIPATPDGQKQFMMRLNTTITGLGEKGIGYCYWAPDWVAYKGPTADDGSPYENVTLFDFENRALPALEVFSGE